MTKKKWQTPQVKSIRAGSAESGSHPGNKDNSKGTKVS
jgi:hypothetical protein